MGFWSVTIDAQLDPSRVDADTCAPFLEMSDGGKAYLVNASARLRSAFATGKLFGENEDSVGWLPEQNSTVSCSYANGNRTVSFNEPRDERLVAPAGFFDETVGAGYTEPAPAVCSAFDRSQGFC